MKIKKILHDEKQPKIKETTGTKSLGGILMFTLFAVLCIVLFTVPRIKYGIQENQVFAAAESETQYNGFEVEGKEYRLPAGMAGVAYGLECSMPGVMINRIGTSCEQLIVGQRARRTQSGVTEWNVSESMASTVDQLDSAVFTLSAEPKIMSDTDYDTLLRIVEAESGSEDLKGKILVANVIMNRVKNEEFPDTVTEVVWEYDNGVPQFSPTYDGRISTVTVSDETREAVKQVLEGVDYSEGALFFIQKSAAEKDSVSWFEKDLKKLFKHGSHEFYTYPDEGEEAEKDGAESESTVVQMVKK